jgi:tetratricopeptide (TPR) repeat protein
MTSAPAALEQIMAAALQSYTSGHFAQAAQGCRQLLVHAPRHPAVHQLLAVLALTDQRLAAARQHIIQSLNERPQHGPTLLIAGKIARAEGDLATAAHYLDAASAAMPGTDEADYWLAETLLELDAPSANTIAVLRRLLSHHARHARAWWLLGQALRKNDDVEAALEAFRTAAQCAPDMSKAHFHIATTLSAQGRTGEAIAVFRHAAALAPDVMEIALNLGSALREHGELAAACKAFEDAIALQPAFAEGWFNLGLARQDLHDFQGAAAAFEEALRRRPDYADAALNLGIALQEARRMEDALAAYRVALRLQPALFGRIAHAMTAGSTGQICLSGAHLKRVLRL